MNGGHLLTAMDELKQILATPIKAYHEEEHPSYDDIPSRFTRVLGKSKLILFLLISLQNKKKSYYCTISEKLNILPLNIALPINQCSLKM